MKAEMCFDDFFKRVKAASPDNFSNKGLRVLYDYIEATLGKDWEFDIGVINQEYAESSFKDFAKYHGIKCTRETIVAKIKERSYFIGFPTETSVLYGKIM
jgi:hypothetical protein